MKQSIKYLMWCLAQRKLSINVGYTKVFGLYSLVRRVLRGFLARKRHDWIKMCCKWHTGRVHVVLSAFLDAVWSSAKHVWVPLAMFGVEIFNLTKPPGHPSATLTLGAILHTTGSQFSSVENFASLVTFKFVLIFFLLFSQTALHVLY